VWTGPFTLYIEHVESERGSSMQTAAERLTRSILMTDRRGVMATVDCNVIINDCG
jgi:hypothetical protein